MPPTPSPSPVNVRERGYVVDANDFWTTLSEEATPELRWPHNIAVYKRMRDQDAQVGSVLRAVAAPIMRTSWTLNPTGVPDEVARFCSENLGIPLKGEEDLDEQVAPKVRHRDRFSWSSHLRLALLILPFGHMVFEQVYRFDDDGMLRLRKLGPRFPSTIAKFNVARDGGLVSIEQQMPWGSRKAPVLDINRLVVYTLEREGGNWAGRSLLRAAYKNWLLKDRALRTWSMSIDRQGLGLPVYEAGEFETNLDAGERIARNARAGDYAGAAIPHGAALKLLGVEGELPDPDKFVRYQDEQIARAVLAHFLNLGTQTGSWALGSTFADFFTNSLQTVAEEIRATAAAHIVEDLVDVNFGTTTPAPALEFAPIGARDSELDRVRAATGLSSDAELIRFLRGRTSTDPEETSA